MTVFGAARMAGKCSNNQFLGCTTSKGCGSGGTCIFPSSNTGAPRCYTCGNDRPTRCTNSRPVACTSLCSVGVAVGSDPFSGVASHTAKKCNGTNCARNDAAVNCRLTSTDIGTSGELIDVCSYPSALGRRSLQDRPVRREPAAIEVVHAIGRAIKPGGPASGQSR